MINLISGAIDPIAFQFGPFAIHWYGLLIGAAIVVAYQLIVREGNRQGFHEDALTDTIFWMILWGFVGARIYYVLFRWAYYKDHLNEIIQVWQGGLAVYGGIIGGILALIYFSKKHHWNLTLLLDIVAPAVLIGQVIGRWGNFMNQEAHGGVVTREFLEGLQLPNFMIEQMYTQGAYYHPTFLYESLWNLLGFLLIIFLRNKQNFLKQGEVALGYFLWYGSGRMVIEGMRTDSLYLGPLRVSQWLSIVLVVMSIILIIVRRRQIPPVPAYRSDTLTNKS